MKLIKHKRRRLIVNKEMQYDVLMYLGVFVVSLFVTQAITAYLFIEQVKEVAIHMSAMEFIKKFQVSFMVYQIIPLALCLIFGIYIFNRLTIRIAGPLYNMKRLLRAATTDKKRDVEIKLREDDYFQEEIEDINVFLKRKI